MGLRWKVGYDRERAPCDEKYHAPEEFLDETHWQAYDVYSVGLVLVRLLFRPLWDVTVFSSFLHEFRDAKSSLDVLFTTLVVQQAQLPAERAERVLARSSKINKPVFTTVHRRGGEAPDVSRGREYLELAGEQCFVDLEDEEEEEEEGTAKEGEEGEEEEERERVEMNLCLFTQGLLALERASTGAGEGEGLTWATLRGILAKEPGLRLLPETALERLEADAKKTREEGAGGGGGGGGGGGAGADVSALAGVKEEVKKLKAEHREVNEETDILCMGDTSNAMISYRLQELKKRKLQLKDRIASLETLLASNRPSKQ